MVLREYKITDCAEIAELFYDTVHSVNAKDYTKEQLDAWATGKVNLEEWNRSFLDNYSFVAVENGKIVGFGDMEKSGHLNRLFVHKGYQGRGIATAICGKLESTVLGRITVCASITAKPFFEKRNYNVIKSQQMVRNGVVLTSFVMELKRQK